MYKTNSPHPGGMHPLIVAEGTYRRDAGKTLGEHVFYRAVHPSGMQETGKILFSSNP